MTETPGAAARRTRLELGLSQKDLAQLLGISPAYLHDIEKGSRSLPQNIIGKMPEPIKSAVVAAVKSGLRNQISEIDTL